MNTFGEQLKQERERRNVGLDEIARSTKIRVRYLQALEDGQHERLPGIVFAKGYVRAYAETIGADADGLVRAYVDEQRALGRLQTECSQEGVLEALAAAVEHDRKPARVRKWLAVAAVVLAAGATFWFGIRPLMDRQPDTTTSAKKTAPVEVQVARPPSLSPAPAPLQKKSQATTDDDATKTAALVDREDASLKSEPAQQEPEPTPAPEQRIASNEPPEDSVEAVTSTAPPVTTPSRTVVSNDTSTTHSATEPTANLAAAPVESSMLDSALTIPDHGVGTGVQRRALVGEASLFDEGAQIVFWTRVMGGEPGREVKHVWSHEGNVIGTVTLAIGGTHWRTYSRRTLRLSGNWSVVAQDEAGRILASRDFIVR